MLSAYSRAVLRCAPRGSATATARRWSSNIIASRFEDVAIPTSPLTEYVLENCEKHGDKPAFVNGLTGASISFKELPGRIASAAAVLQDSGFKRLIDSQARFVVTSKMFGDTVSEAVVGCDVDKVFFVDEEECFVHSVDEGATPPSPQVNPKTDTVVLPYSSGTTGLPKGVVLSHTNLVANIAQIVEHPVCNLGFSDKDIMLGLLPFFHIYGMVVIMNAALRTGATVVTLPSFDPETFLTTLQDHKMTFAPLVPPLILFLAKHPVVDKFDLSHLSDIFSGAAPLDAELQTAVAKRLPNVNVRQGYGMTEMSPVSTLSPPSQVVAGSAGMLVPNAEARIVDPETGEDLPGDGKSRGELLVRGPHIMQGYLNNPEATAETLTEDGWLHSGDIAYYDDDTGHFFVVDRLKELIKVKGFQVAPAELEGLLLEHPQISDCAVLGQADERSGEIPVAYVVTTPESNVAEADVKAFLEPKVAEYKQLGAVHFVDEIPKSASGKILKRVLRGE